MKIGKREILVFTWQVRVSVVPSTTQTGCSQVDVILGREEGKVIAPSE